MENCKHFRCIRVIGPKIVESVDPFADLDQMLNPENEESDDLHLLTVCATADEYEELYGRKI